MRIWVLSFLSKDYLPTFRSVKFHSFWAMLKVWCALKLNGHRAWFKLYKGPSRAELLHRINYESEVTNG